MNIQQLLEAVIERKASDLHLVVGYPPSFRVHGELVSVVGGELVTDADMSALEMTVLNPIQKKIFTETFELDFAIPFANRARFRVNFYRQLNHISADFRLIPMIIPELNGLGLPPAVEKLTNLKQGLILVTGPTGHGKSTTLAAILNEINQKKAVNILTIEDPVEYVYPKAKAVISQREMFQDTKSWPNALRAALREDPDVVLVGEMRDPETISATITVAETGHLVFATLHTNSASQSVDRIIDSFPAYQQSQVRSQLSLAIEAIVSQRLIPTITPGRALAAEVLLKNSALSSLIRDAKTHLIDNLIQTSAELGMVSLESSLASLVNAGKISFEVAQSYALRPGLLAKLLGHQ